MLIAICLIFLAFYALQLPEVQTQISNKATLWLSQKLGGSVTVSKVRVSWFDEVVFEDVNIKDHKDRNMIYVRELYVNTKTNFGTSFGEVVSYTKKDGIKFEPGKLIKFDNNLDFVTLNSPNANFIRDNRGLLNFDYWLLEIDSLTASDKKRVGPPKAFTLDNAHIRNGRVSITSEVYPIKTDGTFDFANFDFRDLNTDLKNLYFRKDTVRMLSKKLTARDHFSKLFLKDLTGNFYYTKRNIHLDNLSAKLNDSYIGPKLHFNYSRPSDFNDFFNKIFLDANLVNSRLQSADIALFIPSMGQYKEEYNLTTKASGLVSDLSLSAMTIKFGTGSYINGNVKLQGLPQLSTMRSQWNLSPSVLLSGDILQYSANPEFQKYAKKIEKLDFSGVFDGVYNDFTARPKLVSSKLGEIVGDVKVKAGKTLEYSGNLLINKFKIGTFLEEPQLDEITFLGKINGSGRTLKEAMVHLDGYVSDVDFNGYRYKHINVDGNLGHSLFEGHLKIDDPNILANLNGRVDFKPEVNVFNFKGDVGHANLKVLGFTKQEYFLKTQIDFNFQGNKLDDWLGEAGFYQTIVRKDTSSLKIGSMHFFSDLAANERAFKVKSEFFDIGVKGDFTPSILLEDLSNLLKEHRLFFEYTEKEREKYYTEKEATYQAHNYKAAFDVKFNSPKPFFNFFAPKVHVSPNAWFSGKYHSGTKNRMELSGEIDTLGYNINEFYTTNFEYHVEKETFSPILENKLRVKSDFQKIGNNTLTEELVLNANWEGENTLDFRAFLTQNSSNSLLDLRGKINFEKDGFDIKLLPQQTQVRLIDRDWTFDEANSIAVRGKNVTFNRFFLSNQNQNVGLNGSLSQEKGSELLLTVDKFEVKTIQPFINVDLQGNATGNLRIRDFYDNPMYLSNMHVVDFQYKQSNVGTVTTSAIWDDSKEHLKLSGNVFQGMEEILKLDGFYTPSKKVNPLELEGRLRNCDLGIFMGMTGDVFSVMKGKANGKFKMLGTPQKPYFDGEVDLTKGSLTVASSGTELHFEDKVILTQKGFELPKNGVEMKDGPNGNPGILTGGVYYKTTGKGFNIDLTASIAPRTGFRIMNIKPFSNDYIFGTAYASGDITLGGDFDNLLIGGTITSKAGTKITIPTDAGTKIDTKQEGIQFIKKVNPLDTIALGPKKKQPSVKTGGVRMAFNITLTPEAEGEVIFDRNNNDILSLYGDGKLSVVFDNRGEFTINGPYNLRGGKYYFSFQNLASLRRFDITDQSKIIFNGNPFDAILDIKATYTANININKVSPQMTNSSARFPVFVNVFLTERLLNPSINYDINFDLKQVPISGQTDLLAFEQRLRNDEQLLSRNVSSILVFNEVFPDNNMADALTQQFLIDNISNLLSNQIGNLANKLDPNLELGVQFGNFRESILNNMQLNFSYRFLNNRVKLSGKGAFINSLEDNINMNTNSFGQLSVGGELEYMISDDGTYKFRLYSRSVPTNYYVFYSQGNVVVSGGSLIFSRNFNSFFKKRTTPLIGVGTTKQYE